MARQFKPQIVTANDLFEGDVIYLKADGEWSRYLHEAVVAKDAEAAKSLLDMASRQPHRVVGAYLATVRTDSDGTPQPDHFREAFRARGPSNYFHGKQAILADDAAARTGNNG
jgi:hypothetical protein